MNGIQRQNPEVAVTLDAVSYFNALVREGCRLSLISPEQMETLRYQTVQLLTDQFNRYTGGQSSSVPVETGRQIQRSAFYAIGYYLKGLPDTKSALEALKNSTLTDLFREGTKRIEKTRRSAEKELLFIRENRFTTDLLAYNETLDRGLPLFFSLYDMDYEAHETPASVDYPLGNDRINLTGIDYIDCYLRKLRLENEFCALFPGDEIHDLLKGYDRRYQELLFNIYDLVLTNAVGWMLLDNERIALSLSELDRRYLESKLTALSEAELDRTADEAASRLCARLAAADPLLVSYIGESMTHIKTRLKNALKGNGLQNLFLSAGHEPAKRITRFEDKAKLDQDGFLKLADEIRGCGFISDKLALLEEESPGIADLIDLLEGGCFFENEYDEVFRSLEDVRLALLAGELPRNPHDSDFLEEEFDREWQFRLHAYLEHTEPGRRAAILELAAGIERPSG